MTTISSRLSRFSAFVVTPTTITLMALRCGRPSPEERDRGGAAMPFTHNGSVRLHWDEAGTGSPGPARHGPEVQQPDVVPGDPRPGRAAPGGVVRQPRLRAERLDQPRHHRRPRRRRRGGARRRRHRPGPRLRRVAGRHPRPGAGDGPPRAGPVDGARLHRRALRGQGPAEPGRDGGDAAPVVRARAPARVAEQRRDVRHRDSARGHREGPRDAPGGPRHAARRPRAGRGDRPVHHHPRGGGRPRAAGAGAPRHRRLGGEVRVGRRSWRPPSGTPGSSPSRAPATTSSWPTPTGPTPRCSRSSRRSRAAEARKQWAGRRP